MLKTTKAKEAVLQKILVSIWERNSLQKRAKEKSDKSNEGQCQPKNRTMSERDASTKAMKLQGFRSFFIVTDT